MTDGQAPRGMTSATIRTAFMSLRRIRVGTIQHQGEDDEPCGRRGLARSIMGLCAWRTRSLILRAGGNKYLAFLGLVAWVVLFV